MHKIFSSTAFYKQTLEKKICRILQSHKEDNTPSWCEVETLKIYAATVVKHKNDIFLRVQMHHDQKHKKKLFYNFVHPCHAWLVTRYMHTQTNIK